VNKKEPEARIQESGNSAPGVRSFKQGKFFFVLTIETGLLKKELEARI
jgi:hypothetical protein